MKIQEVYEELDEKGRVKSRRTITADLEGTTQMNRAKLLEWSGWMQKFIALVSYVPGDE